MSKPSTENLNLIPNPEDLQKLCKSISALEAIISPEWEYRYYSYQKDWSESEEFCEMRNGQGDQMLIVYSKDGTCINGFAHESEMNGWKNIPIEDKKSFMDKLFGSKKETKTVLTQEIQSGVVTELPQVFNEFVFGEPVKSIGTTFCIWNTKTDTNWKIGKIDFPKDEYKDGSKDLLELLDGKPLTYKKWAEEYYEEEFENRELKLELVQKIYSGISISKELALEINPELEDFEKLKTDLNEIGYENKI
ncbi:hypothetical protein F7642_12575 [Tenacibaculum finnmarkense genomovar ulcerans]|uniref:hypothetical protein n=1 Tax=Tenacibaculum finnmarkense TaxID=2781243 RepID=UPI00187BAFEC|nr:hypothetical protein [Tenacibaculum finnmarkense]MBE7635158.1 hypothetical protein [Tenacibaculum finnmarkense genomovar ulcerans]MCD8431134.1 hypothetical protein [Tenacibaculum finnmarkense genomovar ulcerans]